MVIYNPQRELHKEKKKKKEKKIKKDKKQKRISLSYTITPKPKRIKKIKREKMSIQYQYQKVMPYELSNAYKQFIKNTAVTPSTISNVQHIYTAQSSSIHTNVNNVHLKHNKTIAKDNDKITHQDRYNSTLVQWDLKLNGYHFINKFHNRIVLQDN